MQDCEKILGEAAFFDGTDTRKVTVETCDDNTVAVTQVVSGPGVVDAFGVPEKLTRARFGFEDAAHLGWLLEPGNSEGALVRYMQDESHDLLDLMDFCDANAIAYAKSSLETHKI